MRITLEIPVSAGLNHHMESLLIDVLLERIDDFGVDTETVNVSVDADTNGDPETVIEDAFYKATGERL